MRYSIAAAAAAMAIGVSAQNNGTGNAQQSGVAGAIGGANADFQATQYDTVVVQAYVTTCPFATAFTYNGQAYSGAAGQVITVTNCPCTVTAPAGSIPSGALTATAPAQPAQTAPPTNQNNAGSGSGAGTGSDQGAGAGVPSNGTQPTPEEFTGAASKLSVAGLAAVFAIAAYAL